MTKEQSDEWFLEVRKAEPKFNLLHATDKRIFVDTDFWEKMYQAFKGRLASECQINLFPDTEK